MVQYPAAAGSTPTPMSPNGSSNNGANGAQYSNESGWHVKEVILMLRRRALVVAAVALAIFGLVAYRVTTEVPQYRATAAIRLTDQRKALTGAIDQRSAFQDIVGAAIDPVLSQIQVITSRRVAEEVVDRVGLRVTTPTPGFAMLLDSVLVKPAARADTIHLRFGEENYTIERPSRDLATPYGRAVVMGDVQFAVTGRPETPTGTLIVRTRKQAIVALRAGLTARRREKTDIVEVEYVSSDPRVAQQVANAVVEAYQELNVSTAQKQSRIRREFIAEQLRQTDSIYSDATRALAQFRSRAGVFSSRDRYMAEQQGLLDLQLRREELDAERRIYAGVLRQLNGPTQTRDLVRALASTPGLAANPILAQLYNQLVQLETTRDSMTSGRWGNVASSPQVSRVDTLLARTEARIAVAVRAQVASLDERLRTLDDLRARNASQLQRLPASDEEEVRLMQQVESTQRIANQLREEYQKARIAEAIEAGQVEILDLAELPASPIGGGSVPKLFFALLAGLMLGGAAAYMLEYMNTTIRRSEEIESVLGLAGLGVIPRITADHPASITNRLRSRSNGTTLTRAGSAGTHQLAVVKDERSPGAEAYRAVRTNLLFSQAVRSLKVLVLTSPSPSEGKTTTCSNLAATFAAQGLNILLIDADLRRPKLHDLLGLPREPGITDCILGNIKLDAAIMQTKLPSLSVLTAGTAAPNPAELLGGEAMRELITAASRKFDMVILDSPPVLAAADALITAAHADGTLLVIRAGQTEREAARHALQRLEEVGAHVLGAVLNDPDSKVPRNTSGYYSSYAYTYYGATD